MFDQSHITPACGDRGVLVGHDPLAQVEATMVDLVAAVEEGSVFGSEVGSTIQRVERLHRCPRA